MNRKLFSKFILVGIFNTIIGITTMYVLLHLGFSYWTSTFIGNLIGALNSYIWNKTFTFRSNKSISTTVFRFFLTIGICYLIAYSISQNLSIWVLHQILVIPLTVVEEIAILGGTCLYTLLNYYGQKRFVFNN